MILSLLLILFLVIGLVVLEGNPVVQETIILPFIIKIILVIVVLPRLWDLMKYMLAISSDEEQEKNRIQRDADEIRSKG